MHAMDRAAFAGVDLVEVRTSWREGKGPIGTPPRLWEIVVSGTAWRKGSDDQSITTCRDCRRAIFPNASQLDIDETRWDGSDFFHVDRNPNIVLVTERVRDLFESSRYSNVRCVSTMADRTA
jgi:hypothetical protein